MLCISDERTQDLCKKILRAIAKVHLRLLQLEQGLTEMKQIHFSNSSMDSSSQSTTDSNISMTNVMEQISSMDAFKCFDETLQNDVVFNRLVRS